MDQSITEEQLEIIRHMLLKSPPGELYIVLKEIEDILEGIAIPSEFLEKTLKEYNLTYHTLVDVPDGNRPLLIVGTLDDESNVYSDNFNKKSYRFNHLNNSIEQEVEYEEIPASSSTVEQLKQFLYPEVRKYLSERFCKQSGAYIGNNANHIDLLIVGELTKLSSYYTGRWVSHYTIEYVDDSMKLKGEVQIQSHYFENGNVQMNVQHSLPSTSIPFSGTAKDASEIIKQISTFEDNLQSSLKEVFNSFQKDALKDFRRQLPHTRQHFQWNMNAHKMADTMKELKK